MGNGKVVFTANEAQLHPELIPGTQDLDGDGLVNDPKAVLVFDVATGEIMTLNEASTSTVDPNFAALPRGLGYRRGRWGIRFRQRAVLHLDTDFLRFNHRHR